MQLIPEANSIESYLESSDVIDLFNPNIQIVAEDLRRDRDDEVRRESLVQMGCRGL